MQLEHQELNDLATFFSKRAPSAEERYLIRQRARIQAGGTQSSNSLSGWMQILEDASDQRKLHRLAYIISAEYPDDNNLQQVCQLLAEKHLNKGLRQTAMFGLPVAAIAMTMLLWPRGDVAALQPQSVSTPEITTALLQPQTAQLQPQSVKTPEAPEVATLQPQSVKEASDLLEPAVRKGPKRTLKQQTPIASNQQQPTGSELLHVACDRAENEVIGYWYSGENAVGQQGDTVTIAQTVNVRAEYPSFRNEYSPRTPVQCVLFEGEQIKLSHPPILVAGDRYWIPVTGRDLIRS
jgi:hypothetical protein